MAVGAEKLICLTANKTVNNLIFIFIFFLVSFNFCRFTFIFYYYQPVFDKSQNTSAYPTLAKYISGLKMENKITIAKSFKGESVILYSNWLLQGHKMEKINDLMNYSKCDFNNPGFKDFSIYIVEPRAPEFGYNLLQVIKNLSNDEVFWIIQKKQSQEAIQ